MRNWGQPKISQKGGGSIINWLSSWASAIIVAVIIGTIIEMILPEGNSKKYIKVVIGIYVLFSIVSPVITKFTGKDIQVSDVLELDKYVEEVKETSKMQNTLQSDNENNIMNMYSEGIKDDIRAKIKAKGYIVNSIDIDIANDESYSILSLNINVTKEEEKTQTDDKKNNTNEELVEEIEPINNIEINIEGKTGSKNEVDSNENNTENQKDNLSNSEKNKLKEYLSSVYDIKEDCITVN